MDPPAARNNGDVNRYRNKSHRKNVRSKSSTNPSRDPDFTFLRKQHSFLPPLSPKSVASATSSDSSELDTYSKNRYWLDKETIPGIASLLKIDGFAGQITNMNDDSFCVEECGKGSVVLPLYIAKLPVYTERECRYIMNRILACVATMHEHNLTHRNLHINNLVVSRSGILRLRGMRYAAAFTNGVPISRFCGFRHNWYAFRAPETENVDNMKHSEEVDVWSLGAVFYMLLTGLPPFRGSGRELTRNKHSGNVIYDMTFPSECAQELVAAMLEADPVKRLTIQEVTESKWMTEPSDFDLEKIDLSLAQDIFKDWRHKPKVCPAKPPMHTSTRVEL